MKQKLIFLFLLIYSFLSAQYFPFKNENKFDTIEYKRIRDSLIANPQKNTVQTGEENGIFYDTHDGTNIIMQYNKGDGGFLQITKGAHWILYTYFDNLQLRSKKENISRHYATGIWKEFDKNGKLLKVEDMDILYDDRQEYIDKNIKLVSIREIAAKLSATYQKNMFDDVNFFDVKTFVDDKTNKWVYRIVFADTTKESTVLFFDYDAHNGNFIKTESFTIPEGFEWH
ncbi:hypothetical protein [Chryseobacterium gwangjuense]|uniref:hypothetical protein n=1 Tax=Chryseobacterium gwangjuense TaxID=1069980 RepID=UPI001E5DF37C|nr:hypothetical protein [Chryseobacterium gwangjuense]MCE3076655.1 hypothetical protein [Chryseobacterium gwangjuense]